MALAIFASLVLSASAFVAAPVVSGAVDAAASALSRHMRVSSIEVEESGASNLSRFLGADEIRRVSGVQGGQELLKIDLDEVSRRISAMPWVRSVRVSKRLPSTLRIEYSARHARAVLVRGRVPTLVGADGAVIAPLSASLGPARRGGAAALSAIAKEAPTAGFDLPVFLGEAALKGGMAWLDALERSENPRILAVHQVRAEGEGAVECLVELDFGGQSAKVLVKAWATPTATALRRFRVVVDELASRHIAAKQIDLRPGKKVIVSQGKAS